MFFLVIVENEKTNPYMRFVVDGASSEKEAKEKAAKCLPKGIESKIKEIKLLKEVHKGEGVYQIN